MPWDPPLISTYLTFLIILACPPGRYIRRQDAIVIAVYHHGRQVVCGDVFEILDPGIDAGHGADRDAPACRPYTPMYGDSRRSLGGHTLVIDVTISVPRPTYQGSRENCTW